MLPIPPSSLVRLSLNLHVFGVPAETPEDIKRVVKEMEAIGVDMVGLMTGMSYEGVEAGKIHPQVEERVKALVETATVPIRIPHKFKKSPMFQRLLLIQYKHLV